MQHAIEAITNQKGFAGRFHVDIAGGAMVSLA